MRNLLLLAAICLFSTGISFGQRVLLDFEPNTVSTTTFAGCFGAGSLDDGSCYDVVENPDKTGINTSDSVGVYIEPNEGETWMGMFFDMDPTKFTGDSSMMCADVWMPATADFMFKFENPGTAFGHELQPPVANTTTNAWEQICQDANGTPLDGVEVNRLVIFFNFLAIPTATTTYYFDNITQPGATMTTGLKGIKFGGFINAYPNPVKDQLRIADELNIPHTFIISDLTGREVFKEKNSLGGTLNVSNLEMGAYFLRAINTKTGEIRTTRFLKN